MRFTGEALACLAMLPLQLLLLTDLGGIACGQSQQYHSGRYRHSSS